VLFLDDFDPARHRIWRSLPSWKNVPAPPGLTSSRAFRSNHIRLTYARGRETHAEECERLAKTMQNDNRRSLLDIGASWRALAAEAERQTGVAPRASGKDGPTHEGDVPD
jgi:hypothetical protein